MRYCKRCLQPDTRPNITFDENGVCPPCNYSEVVKKIEWDERRADLKQIIKFAKSNNSSGYDCIIGVSGGKDSLRQAIFVKEELQLNPLLVSLNYPPEQMTERGASNISNMISFGFDTTLFIVFCLIYSLIFLFIAISYNCIFSFFVEII